MTSISKRRFGKIRALHVKKERQATGLTLLEGERLVSEALHTGLSMEAAVGTGDFWARRMDLVHKFSSSGIHTSLVSEKQMAMLTLTEHSAGVLAVVSCPETPSSLFWEKIQLDDFFGLMTVGIQDPGNLGTLIRTMAAAGGSGVCLSQGNTEIGSPKVLRASAGAVYRIPVLEKVDMMNAISRFREAGIQIVASVADKGKPYTVFDFTKPTVILVGSEGKGLPTEVISACTDIAQIPMPGGTESLNVSAAGAILIYETVRQRRLSQAISRRK